MNKTTIEKALRASTGGTMFITRSQLKRCMGFGNSRTDEILRGLDCLKFAGERTTKRYDITEVAGRLLTLKEGGLQ